MPPSRSEPDTPLWHAMEKAASAIIHGASLVREAWRVFTRRVEKINYRSLRAYWRSILESVQSSRESIGPLLNNQAVPSVASQI